MGKVYSVISRKANRPFFLDRICTQVYSGEEFLYCMGENPELLTREMFSNDLIAWLEEECSANDIADLLRKLLSNKADLIQIVSSLLSLASFISYEEKDKIVKVMRDSAGSSEFDKRKARGDFFIGKERFAYAIREYELLLETVKDEESDRVACVYHNMGVAKARMFLFEQAGEDFLRAYDMDEDDAHYYAYIATLRFALSEMEYVKKVGNDSSMSDIMLKLEADLENAKKAFKESEEYIDYVERQAESRESGRSAFCSFLDSKLAEKKEDYIKFVM